MLRDGEVNDLVITCSTKGTPYAAANGETIVIVAHERPIKVRIARAIHFGEFRIIAVKTPRTTSKRNYFYDLEIPSKTKKRYTIRYNGLGSRIADSMIGLLVHIAIMPISDKPSHFSIEIHN